MDKNCLDCKNKLLSSQNEFFSKINMIMNNKCIFCTIYAKCDCGNDILASEKYMYTNMDIPFDKCTVCFLNAKILQCDCKNFIFGSDILICKYKKIKLQCENCLKKKEIFVDD